jgi:hypothetical protein
MKWDILASIEKQHSINLEEWRLNGARMWDAVRKEKMILLPWKNPWPRCLALGSGMIFSALFLHFTFASAASSVLSVLLVLGSVPLIFSAVKLYSQGFSTGGLYSFFTEHGFGVGCSKDRLLIPYSELCLPPSISPSTVNENYIVLPLARHPKDLKVETSSGTVLEWDGKPYVRGILSVFSDGGDIVVKAFPNEMIAQLFCAIHPLCVFLKLPSLKN